MSKPLTWRVTNIIKVAVEDDTVTITADESLRGLVTLELTISEARWLFASLLDERNAGNLGEWE
jgi:hypothetical protein